MRLRNHLTSYLVRCAVCGVLIGKYGEGEQGWGKVYKHRSSLWHRESYSSSVSLEHHRIDNELHLQHQKIRSSKFQVLRYTIARLIISADMPATQHTNTHKTTAKISEASSGMRNYASPDHWYCCNCNTENDARGETDGTCTDCSHAICDTCTLD